MGRLHNVLDRLNKLMSFSTTEKGMVYLGEKQKDALFDVIAHYSKHGNISYKHMMRYIITIRKMCYQGPTKTLVTNSLERSDIMSNLLSWICIDRTSLLNEGSDN